jgi:hypothetical protein
MMRAIPAMSAGHRENGIVIRVSWQRTVLRWASAFLSIVATGGSVAADTDRQSLDDAWWTGPIIAAGAGTLPRGHFLIEPYVYDAIAYGRYDDDGKRHSIPDAHSYGSLTYLLYGLADRFTVGLIPTFGFNKAPGSESSGIQMGDLSLQAQYRLTQFTPGEHVPTTSLVVQYSLPTGKYDRLGDRPADGLGSGASATTLALYSQYYFWMPNGRILRTRLNVARTFADDTDVHNVSVYGTPEGFQGRARPGKSFSITSAWEYSVTRNWVLALDVLYQRDDSTKVRGFVTDARASFNQDSGSSRRLGVAPAVEFNWNEHVGVIVGARWFVDGRNTTASITPVAAINIVY